MVSLKIENDNYLIHYWICNQFYAYINIRYLFFLWNGFVDAPWSWKDIFLQHTQDTSFHGVRYITAPTKYMARR